MIHWKDFGAFLIQNFAWFGLAGSLIILAAMGISGLVFRGRQGENYSAFNHFISELGEVGISRLAVVFNFGLILGSLVFIPFLVGFGLALGNTWGKIALAAGMVTALSCMAVGIFPTNQLNAHVIAAMTFFRSGLVTVLLFSVAVFTQPSGQSVIPRSSNLAGLLAVVCYAVFLLSMDKAGKDDPVEDVQEMREEKDRPRFWKIPMLEWLVFFSTILWFFLVALLTLIG